MTVRSPGRQAATGRLLRLLTSLDGVDVAFAAAVDARAGTFVLDRFEGARTDQLRGVTSPPGLGLGGKCIVLRRPVFVRDYATARGITHQFDRQVAGEGLRAIFAVPVLDDGGDVREIVYGAARRSLMFGERLIDRAVEIVTRSSHQEQEPERLAAEPAGDVLGELRRALAAIADDITDPSLRRRLCEVVDMIPGAGRGAAGVPPVKLSRRELDVLAEVAQGHGNRRIGERLGLTEQTVKSYLKSVMFKLDSSTRGEAVFRARAAGLLG